MERVGEEDAVCALDQGVKLREPAVAQTMLWAQRRGLEQAERLSERRRHGTMEPGEGIMLCGT